MPRDFSVAYTEAELEGLKEVFRTLPTFQGGGYILSSDIPALLEKIDIDRSPEQLAAYKAHYDNYYGGIVPYHIAVTGLRALHDVCQMGVVLAKFFHKNGGDIISTEEFEELLTLLVIHEPKLKGISSQAFFKDANTSGDGKVSIEECRKWIEKYVQNL